MTRHRCGVHQWAVISSRLFALALLIALSSARAQESEAVSAVILTKIVPSLQPRQFAAVAHDRRHSQSLLFGGTYGSERFDDTWLLEPSGWQVQSPRTHPSARISAALTYDDAHDDFVLFGGRVAHTKAVACSPGGAPQSLATEYFCSDTWLFRNGNWTRKTLATSPSAREGHALVYDAARRQVVLFGGTAGGSAAPLSDTWVWNGVSWKQVTPAHHPSGRFWHTMAYDPIHQQVVLFGGNGGTRILNDTWIWNGKDWQPARAESTPPELRTNAAMDFDPTTHNMVMFSGTAWSSQRSGLIATDSWSWDGARWSKLPDSKFDLVTNFSKLTAKQAEDGLLANGTPTYLWLPEK